MTDCQREARLIGGASPMGMPAEGEDATNTGRTACLTAETYTRNPSVRTRSETRDAKHSAQNVEGIITRCTSFLNKNIFPLRMTNAFYLRHFFDWHSMNGIIKFQTARRIENYNISEFTQNNNITTTCLYILIKRISSINH